MSNVFRKARKLLASEGLSSEYIKYAIGEIVLVVVGILIALSINNWNSERKNEQVEYRILTEISNGLIQDRIDITHNKKGHQWGLDACNAFIASMQGQKIASDSAYFYYHCLLRDFTSVQNTSGYESLKSKGFEIVKNDTLRTDIIILYEQLAPSQRKLEESYEECQFFANYFDKIHSLVSDHLIFNQAGDLVDLSTLSALSEQEKKELYSLLWRVKRNRKFVISNYEILEASISELQASLKNELDK